MCTLRLHLRWQVGQDLYVDGELKKDDSVEGKLVGGRVDPRLEHREGSSHWYNGLLDEIAVFSVALNEKQVKEASEELSEELSVLIAV